MARSALSHSRTSAGLANLRGFTILIVLAFHSVLAYARFNPGTAHGFDDPPYNWRGFPIADSHRWFSFDLFCGWQDVYLMSLMFFLSGLFVWPSMTRKSLWGFARDRLLRLGLPYAFAVAILMPLAIYPVYLQTAVDPSVAAYWQHFLALPFWPNGPMWFLLELMGFNLVIVGVSALMPLLIPRLGQVSLALGQRPVRYFVIFLALSTLVYLPPALVFTPWKWFDTAWLPFQISRVLHYALYFVAGVGIGAGGLDRGLIAPDGSLQRRWALLLAAATISWIAWMGMTALTMNGDAPITLQIIADLAFVVACACGSFCFVAMCMHFAARQSRPLGVLADNAYSFYLVHYGFVVWLQYALLPAPLHAVLKGGIVSGGTLALSWIAVLILQRVPLGARLIGLSVREALTS